MPRLLSSSLLVCSFLLGTSSLLTAGEPAAAASSGDRRAELMKRFDTNGDGQLSEQERQAARQMMEKFRSGQGQGQAQGKRPAGMKLPSREELIKRFDTDGDGQLSEQERQAARAQFQKGRARLQGAKGTK